MDGRQQEGRVEMVVIAGKDLKSITSFLGSGNGKMSSYVVCWVDPSSKRSTRIVKRGGRDPVWNHPLSLPVDAAALANPYACLTLQVMSSSPSRYDAVVGTAWMPLHEIARLSTTSSAFDNTVTLPVQRPSGRMQGSIRLCVCLIGAGFDGGSFQQRRPLLRMEISQVHEEEQQQHRWRPQNFSPFSSYSNLFEEIPSPSSLSGGEPVEGIPVIGYAAAGSGYNHGRQQQHGQVLPASPSAPPVQGNGHGQGHGHGDHGYGNARGNGHGVLLGILGGVFAALLVGEVFFQ